MLLYYGVAIEAEALWVATRRFTLTRAAFRLYNGHRHVSAPGR
jgi:hypothetical protein